MIKTLSFCEGNRVKLPRYVIETDLKPAIFGSYSYDMVNGEFVINNDNSSTTEINLTDIIFNTTSKSSVVDESYRKHVSRRVTSTAMKSFRTINWWTRARELLKNTTLFKHYRNQNKTNILSVTINSQLNNTL